VYEGTRPADNLKLVSVYDDRCSRVYPDAQHARISRHNFGHSAFAVRALVHVHIDGRIWKQAEARSICFGDQISKVFIGDTTAYEKRAQYHRAR
jgi:hypothetical protein